MSSSSFDVNRKQTDDDASSALTSILAGSIQSKPGVIQIMNTELESNQSVGAEQEEIRVGSVSEGTTVASASVRSDVGEKPPALTWSAKSVTTRSVAGSIRSRAQSAFSRQTRCNTFYSSEEDSHLRPATSIHVNMLDNECQLEIPMPIMPYETRNAKLKQLSVSVFCLIMSLIITLTCGRGKIGLDTALIMYPTHSIPFTVAVIPTDLEINMADIDEPIAIERGVDNAVFWYVSKSGAKFLGIILFQCLRLVEASNIGSGRAEHELQFLEDDVFNIRYVNVDTTTLEGITRAKSLDLGSSGFPDVIGTPLVFDIVHLFDPSHRGRFFTILRDPIDRASALFEEEKLKNHGLEEMTLTDFVQSPKYQDNFLTRSLTNKNPSDIINDDDLLSAKAILHNKFVIGLFDRMEESFVRFEKYFGWSDLIKTDSTRECIRINTPKSTETFEVSSDLFSVPIIGQNAYDLQLYDYAKELFKSQGSLIPS